MARLTLMRLPRRKTSRLVHPGRETSPNIFRIGSDR